MAWERDEGKPIDTNVLEAKPHGQPGAEAEWVDHERKQRERDSGEASGSPEQEIQE